MNNKDTYGVKCFIAGIVLTVLIFGLVNVARAQELQCISEDQAMAYVGVKPDVVLVVPPFKYKRVAVHNAQKLKVYIPSNRMVSVISQQYPALIFIVYMADQCATGIIAMDKQEYISLAGADT